MLKVVIVKLSLLSMTAGVFRADGYGYRVLETDLPPVQIEFTFRPWVEIIRPWQTFSRAAHLEQNWLCCDIPEESVRPEEDLWAPDWDRGVALEDQVLLKARLVGIPSHRVAPDGIVLP